MYRQSYKKIKQSFLKKIVILSFIALGLILTSNIYQNKIKDNHSNQFKDNFSNDYLKLLSQSNILFERTEDTINITDYGKLFKYKQEVTLTNQEEFNLSYYLDDNHEWKASNISTSVTNIQDTRDWMKEKDFYAIDTPFRKNVSLDNYDPPGNPIHNYSLNLDNDPTDPLNIDNIIIENNADAIRIHFSRIEIETDWDLLCIYDGSNNLQYTFTGAAMDHYTPFIRTNTLKITMNTDGSIQWYGYHIDFYEYYNESTNYYGYKNSWGYNNNSNAAGFSPGEIDNSTAMQITLLGTPGRDVGYPMDVTYNKGDFSEIYQNLTIPRGCVINGYISFNYYAESVMASNENYLYCEIDNKKIYSKGLGDIVGTGTGRRIWHYTGKINLALWINTSNIFGNTQQNQKFNISIGIMSGASVTYSGFEERFQQIFWFDNLTLSLTTLANSTQQDVNLMINRNNLDQGIHWGKASLNISGTWEENPIYLTLNTSSPSLFIELDTIIYGYHPTTSKIGQTLNNGVSYKILENGSIIWEFSHNFYMPSDYSDFEFVVNKPLDWKFFSVLDPTLESMEFEGGNIGDYYLKINKTNARYPGWWTFKATSPNFLNELNTQMLKQGVWGADSFTTGDSTKIRTQINYSGQIPPNLALTLVNLTIYDPMGNLFYEESRVPLTNGTVIFSEINFTASNTIGGYYNYTLFWTNHTALGGIKSNFIVIHNATLTLLKPDDAKIDLRTDGLVGDIIPLRVFLKDSENDVPISNAIITYNWTDGFGILLEAALGVYETTIDTGDLNSRGLYNIIIGSSKIGFFEANITLEINLGEESKLQRLESEYNIELHANSNIKFKFMDYGDNGIDGALVNISISNPAYYSINNTGGGIYNIEFSTLYINDIGMYQLNFSFQAIGYEPQYYVYHFQIIKQSVNLTVSINSLKIEENSLIESIFYDIINISARPISIIDKDYITGGIITLISGTYEKNLTEFINVWYNSSIQCSPNIFDFGINYIYLKFQHPNYMTQTFGFELLVKQIEINVDILGFEDTVNVDEGGTLNLQIQLLDPKTEYFIENATISYSWDYGVGVLTETNSGTYQLNLDLPENLQGNFKFNLIITKQGTVYKTTQFSFLLIIGESSFPTWILWLIIISSTVIIAILGTLSFRSYVLIPRKRKKQTKLLSRTQKFKDLMNIEAIVVIHRISGIPLYSKSYSILERQKKELFSGFIQAITTIGEEIIGKTDITENNNVNIIEQGPEKILELDFKYFYCLVCDREEIRIVFILEEKASQKLKNQISNLALGIYLQLSDKIGEWDGSLDQFDQLIPPIINDYFELYYKELFLLNDSKSIAEAKKESEFNTMENRVLNVIYSVARSKSAFYLEYILESVHEENKDKVIDALESLIQKKIIIPKTN